MSIQTPKIEKKVTMGMLQTMKGKEPIVMVTAYDALFARLFDGEVEMILVGDSLNMSFLGKPDTVITSYSIHYTKLYDMNSRSPAGVPRLS